VNLKGAQTLQKNMEVLGPIIYTADELAFAKKIQEISGGEQTGLNGKVNPLKATKENPDGGSTDVGDISWLVPEITALVTTAPANAPWHSWAVVACGGMSVGHKGMFFAAKSLAMTMVDLYENEQLRKDIRTEFEERRGGHVYKAYIPEGPPPVPANN